MDEKIKKLPKWAQELIEDLNRKRETAIRALNEFCDNQTPSKFIVGEHLCTGEGRGPVTKQNYIQTSSIKVVNADIELHVFANKDDRISLQWNRLSTGPWDRVALVPKSYMKCELIPVEPVGEPK
jgi:hypothetical protein